MITIEDIIEKKSYDENCGLEIIEALDRRVFVYEPGIIYLKEIPIQSPFTIELMVGKAITLGTEFEKWSLILDLREAKRPNAIVRRKINEVLKLLMEKEAYISILTRGILLNTAIHFVMYGLDMKSYSVNNDFDNVLQSARKSLK